MNLPTASNNNEENKDSKTYYAWSHFHVDGKRKFKPGDKVTADDVGGEDEFKAYIESGAVRTTQYPDMGGYEGSPREYRLEQLNAAARGEEYEVAKSRLPSTNEDENEAS